MTAPSEKHGILFARGDFEYSLYLSLARGQREKGGKSVFGLQVAAPEKSASPEKEVSAQQSRLKGGPMEASSILAHLTATDSVV